MIQWRGGKNVDTFIEACTGIHAVDVLTVQWLINQTDEAICVLVLVITVRVVFHR